ncbi:MAG: PQQ-binding-like beta-propeller repeat protein, partial [Planctomycetia bacterium]|nr:PQQ-binding-like beta-propeller repeat protein [Planctomycetia bacterium]
YGQQPGYTSPQNPQYGGGTPQQPGFSGGPQRPNFGGNPNFGNPAPSTGYGQQPGYTSPQNPQYGGGTPQQPGFSGGPQPFGYTSQPNFSGGVPGTIRPADFPLNSAGGQNTVPATGVNDGMPGAVSVNSAERTGQQNGFSQQMFSSAPAHAGSSAQTNVPPREFPPQANFNHTPTAVDAAQEAGLPSEMNPRFPSPSAPASHSPVNVGNQSAPQNTFTQNPPQNPPQKSESSEVHKNPVSQKVPVQNTSPVTETVPQTRPRAAQTPPPQRTQAPQRPSVQAPPRKSSPIMPPSAPSEKTAVPPKKPSGIQVIQKPVKKKPSQRVEDERARYRAPEPRKQVRPEMERPERCYWGFPELPPFTCDAKPNRNAPVVDPQGRMVLVSQGRLYALDISRPEPEVVWEYVINSHVPGPIVVDQENQYHIHAADGYLHCITAEGRQSYMPVQVGEPLGYAAPLVDPWGNTLISGYDGGIIRVWPDGKKQSTPYFRCRAKLDSAGVIAGNILYIGSEEGYLFAIGLEDNRGVGLWDQGKEQGYAGGFLNSSPAVTEDGIIVVAARTEKLIGFHPTGEVVFQTNVPGQLLASPVIDMNGNIYAGVSLSTRQGTQGSLVSVDGKSYKIRWRYQAEDMVESTPVVGDDGMIYFGDNAGWLHAVYPRGDKRWAIKFEAPIRSAGAIIAPNLLVFSLDDDVVVGVRCESQDNASGIWPKFGHDLFHSFLGPAAKPLPTKEEKETL